MEELEKRFEKLLIENKDAKLIDAYTDLKKEIYRVMQATDKSMVMMAKRLGINL